MLGGDVSREKLQEQATEIHLKNEGPKMIVNQDILKEAQRVAEEEASKGDSKSSTEEKK